MHDIEAVLALVVLAIAVAAVAPRLRLPAPSILVLVGLGVGFIPGLNAVHPSPELVTLGVLPPLLFAAAQQLSLIDLRQVWRPVAVLALGLVLLTAVTVGLCTWFGWRAWLRVGPARHSPRPVQRWSRPPPSRAAWRRARPGEPVSRTRTRQPPA